MSVHAVGQLLLFFAVVLLASRPLGHYLARVYAGERVWLDRVCGPVERLFYRLAGVRRDEEQPWTRYAHGVLAFHLAGTLLVYLLQRMQGALPLDPQGLGAPAPHLAWNTAVSFVTNTDWQSYSGETTLSYATQMLALTVQGFVSAATGMAILVALMRGLVRKQADTLGSFWVDLVRGTLYVLVPLSFVFALFLVSQGVVQTFSPSRTVELLSGGHDGASQLLALGPAASQVAIKDLGTNGGGFFNANSAHPFEDPTPLASFAIMVSLILIPAALCHTFGRWVRDARQGWALLTAMLAIFVPLLVVCIAAEHAHNPALAGLGLDGALGNMEGKEVRFGVDGSALYAAATTAASNGGVVATHDSFTPLGGMIPLVLIQLGEIVFGGVGSGLYGLLVFVIVTVFVSGLMVGRTPEYLGKKIEAREMKLASLVILVPAALVLVGTAVGVSIHAGKHGISNPGPHGFTEVLYAFSSAANNNGSAFGGLSAGTPFYDVALGVCMWLGRFFVAIPVLALAGALAKKKLVPPGPGTLPTHTPLFVLFLVGVVIVIGALTFFPALALGPIVEHLTLHAA